MGIKIKMRFLNISIFHPTKCTQLICTWLQENLILLLLSTKSHTILLSLISTLLLLNLIHAVEGSGLSKGRTPKRQVFSQ